MRVKRSARDAVFMTVKYFRRRREGPESLLEDAVLESSLVLEPKPGFEYWVGGAVPLGAGIPDLTLVGFRPEVLDASSLDGWCTHLLAYLRSVPRASACTMATRLARPLGFINSRLAELDEAKAVTRRGDVFRLSARWRNILPDVVSVEAKVSDWRGAILQASRNRVFCHRAFVAFPEQLARRVMSAAPFSRHGIGILGVTDDGETTVVRAARRAPPRVWSYYYQLAFRLAADRGGRIDALRFSH